MNNNRPYWQVALRLMFSIAATVAFVIIGWKLLGFFIPVCSGMDYCGHCDSAGKLAGETSSDC